MEQKEQVRALHSHARMSPAKVRQITRVIQGKNAEDALELLRFIPRKSARLVGKVLRSAIANAENNNNMYAGQLVVVRASANEGPGFRRFRPTARGSAHPYKKRTTHIEIILSPVKN